MNKTILLLLLAGLLICIGSNYSKAEEKIIPKLLEDRIICIDPGHPSEISAGTAVQNGTTEVKIAYQVALELKKILESEYGATVVMTKSKQTQKVTNKNRAIIANEAKADLVIRLHCDSEPTHKKQGSAVYYPNKSGKLADGTVGPSKTVQTESKILSLEIGKALKTIEKKVKYNGIKTDLDTVNGSKQGALTGSIYSKVPVTLIEMVFLSNKKDVEFIKKSENQILFSEKLAEGISNYLNKVPIK